MLAPLAEADKAGPLFEFGRQSLEMYPKFLQQLEFDSETEVVMEGPGLIRMAFDAAEADRMRGLAQGEEGQKMDARWLTGHEVAELQPGVSPRILGGVLSPEEKHVNPRKIMQALIKACARERVTFVEGLHAEAAVRSLSDDIPALYAVGPWTGEVLARFGVLLPVRPVKGQVLIVTQPGHELRYTVYGSGGYLVPRVDGTVALGATSEEAGYDERLTLEGEAELIAKGDRLYPGSSQWERVDGWASLRPGTPDDNPILGRVPGMEKAFVATGHYRNGILQAPITAKLMTELILTGNLPEMLAPFSADRFVKASVA